MLEGHRNMEDMVLSTMETIPGYDVEEHIGLVTGNAIKIANIFKSFMGLILRMFGGFNKDLSSIFAAAREEALRHMIEDAKKLGANAITNIRFENFSSNPSHIEIYVYGTAIKANKF